MKLNNKMIVKQEDVNKGICFECTHDIKSIIIEQRQATTK